MGEVIKKPVTNCNAFVGIYPLSFLFSDINALASNASSVITQISTPQLTNSVYCLSGNFLWTTASPNITGSCTISISGLATTAVYSGLIQCNKEITAPSHYVYWDSQFTSIFVIQAELNNHSDAIFTFNFIFT